MFTILDRAGWGAVPPLHETPHPLTSTGQPVRTVVVHHTTGAAAPFAQRLRDTQHWHLNHPDVRYADIAYNAAVSNTEPAAALLRGPLVQGGATRGHNATTLAVVAVGDYHDPDGDGPTRTLTANMAALLAGWIRAGHVARDFALTAHRDMSGNATLCCGDRLAAELPAIRAATLAAAGDGPPADLLDDLEVMTLRTLALIRAAKAERR